MRRIIVLPILFLVVACGRHAPTTDVAASDEAVSKRSVSAELPAGVKPDSHVLAMREIMGVWASSPGVVAGAPDRHVEIEIAGDGSFQTTLWGADPKTHGKAVFSRQQGHVGIIKDRIAGSASKAPPGELGAFATWSAGAPKDGVMLVRTSGPSATDMPMHRAS